MACPICGGKCRCRRRGEGDTCCSCHKHRARAQKLGITFEALLESHEKHLPLFSKARESAKAV